MLSDDLHQFILDTERQIQSIEEPFDEITKNMHEWTMWLSLENFSNKRSITIDLHEVQTEQDWTDLFQTRLLIEKKYPLLVEKTY